MKVKILRDSNIKNLERTVNAFIKDKCIINISHEVAVEKICDKCINSLVIIILYHEYDHCGYLDYNSIMNFKNNKIN